jgi:hypothetical protein
VDQEKKMPFGLDLKSVIVGALFVWLVLPFIMGMLNRGKTSE